MTAVRCVDGASKGRPAGADLLCDFANTLDVDVDAHQPEALPDAVSLTEWLCTQRLLDRHEDHATEDDLAVAVTLRQGLRRAMRQHSDGPDETDVPELRSVGLTLPMRVDFDGTRPILIPADGGARRGLAQVLIAVLTAQADGTWARYKLCVADDCALAFYDKSKNRSRHWCSMGDCGNRQKVRTFRARQQAERRQ